MSMRWAASLHGSECASAAQQDSNTTIPLLYSYRKEMIDEADRDGDGEVNEVRYVNKRGGRERADGGKQGRGESHVNL